MKTEKETNPKMFLRKIKDVSVDHDFLASLREDLVVHMKMNPIEITKIEIENPEYFHMPSFFYRFVTVPSVAVFVFLLIAGGVAFASQKSLPGDLLYPVKILSEKISIATSLTPQARSKVHLSIAKKRVNEASALIEKSSSKPSKSRERLHREIQSVISNFNAQISTTLDEARDLEKKNDAESALKINNDTRNATDSFKNILLNAKEKSGNGEFEDIDQFINLNNNLNIRAVLGKDDSSNASQKRDDGKNDNEDKNTNEKESFLEEQKINSNDNSVKEKDSDKNKSGKSDNHSDNGGKGD